LKNWRIEELKNWRSALLFGRRGSQRQSNLFYIGKKESNETREEVSTG
jgi:uncharacterized membrane protein YsdA (DUF1294 family)